MEMKEEGNEVKTRQITHNTHAITTQEESHSGGTSVEFYTNVTLLSTLMSQR